MRGVIARARKTLDAAGGVAYECDGDSITVPAPDAEGFTVALRAVSDRRFVVRYGEGWVHEFDRAEDALDCFEFGLSELCRLRVTLRGDAPVAWQLEKREFGLWMPGRRLRTWRVPFWRRARVVYRQNHVFRRETDDAAGPGVSARGATSNGDTSEP